MSFFVFFNLKHKIFKLKSHIYLDFSQFVTFFYDMENQKPTNNIFYWQTTCVWLLKDLRQQKMKSVDCYIHIYIMETFIFVFECIALICLMKKIKYTIHVVYCLIFLLWACCVAYIFCLNNKYHLYHIFYLYSRKKFLQENCIYV